MAPRSRQGTPRINTGSDKGYRCGTCPLPNLLIADVNVNDWTCNVCNDPVSVKKMTSGSHLILVRRVRAQDVVKGDQVYLGHNFDQAYLVTTSEMGRGQTNGHQWKLAMAGQGGTQYRMPDEYVNIA